jgi:hypothetical protein
MSKWAKNCDPLRRKIREAPMQFSFWIWLAVAAGGLAGGLLLRSRDTGAPSGAAKHLSRIFQTVETGTAEAPPTEAVGIAAEGRRILAANATLLRPLTWPLLWGAAALFLGFAGDGATGDFRFEAHRAVWWSWTAGLFCGALLGGAARWGASAPGSSAMLGLSAVGAAMALFTGSEALRGARIEALLGLAAGWIVAREDDDSLLTGVAAILASLALLRDARGLAIPNWASTAGLASLTALFCSRAARVKGGHAGWARQRAPSRASGRYKWRRAMRRQW